MRLYYFIKNLFSKKKPYFSKDKYLANISRYTKRKVNREHFDNVMIDLFGNNDSWFTVMDGEQLIQIRKEEFKFKKKMKIFHPPIPIYWVEWK
jgi:hypothetical protein